MDLYNAILEECQRRKIAHAPEFVPYYISSIGTHMFNLINQTKSVYTEGGIPSNTRQHVLFVTIPGFGKSFLLRQFLESENFSILKGSVIQCGFEGSTTEAGLVGTIKPGVQGGESVKNLGLFFQHANSIIGMEEFSAITNASLQDHNANLDTALLTGLDSGMVHKRLGGGEISYRTNMTLWAGVQPARYNLSSGLGRRFIFLVFTPTWQDIIDFRRSRREAKGVIVDFVKLKALRNAINIRQEELKYLTGVHFTSDFYKELDRLNIIHYEEPLYERLAMGYWFMKLSQVRGNIDIGVDVELSRLIKQEHNFRKRVKEGTTIDQVWAIVKDHKEGIKLDKLLELLIEFSMDYQTATSAVNSIVHGYRWAKEELRTDGKYIIPMRYK